MGVNFRKGHKGSQPEEGDGFFWTSAVGTTVFVSETGVQRIIMSLIAGVRVMMMMI